MINNMPESAKNYSFVVVRLVDDEFWYYGCYNDMNDAVNVADEIDGIVVFN